MGYIEVFQYYQTNNNLLNIVIWKSFFNQIQTQNTKSLRTPRLQNEFPGEGWFTALRLANRIKPVSVL